MAETDVKELRAGKWRRWLRVPGFYTAATISFVTLAMLVAWIRIDAQFPLTLWAVRIQFGLESVPEDPASVEMVRDMWESVKQWGRLGTRVLIFEALVASGLIAAAISLLRLRFTAQWPRRAIPRIVVASALMLSWISLWMLYPRFEWWAIQQRVKGVLPQFKRASDVLAKRWPRKGETVPALGTVPEKYPNILLLSDVIRGTSYPMHEGLGILVEKFHDGTLRFELIGAMDCRVEKHPANGSPSSFKNSFGTRFGLEKSVSLGNGWYLAKYH